MRLNYRVPPIHVLFQPDPPSAVHVFRIADANVACEEPRTLRVHSA